MIPQMEKEMLELIAPKAKDLYGLEVIAVNIKTIGVPETPAKAIAERMIQERDAAAAKYKEEGNVKSRRIMTEADAAKRNGRSQTPASRSGERATPQPGRGQAGTSGGTGSAKDRLNAKMRSRARSTGPRPQTTRRVRQARDRARSSAA